MRLLFPLPDIAESVAVLSDKDLKSQRSYTRKVIRFLEGKSDIEDSEEVYASWKGQEAFLKYYYNVATIFLKNRGRRVGKLYGANNLSKVEMPFWWGDIRTHRGHRSALLSKDYKFYSQYRWEGGTDPDSLYTVWEEIEGQD